MPRTARYPGAGPSIDGRDASLDDAIVAAANLLGNSRCAVIAGLATDSAGAEAAITLARRIGGAIDHMHADTALRDLEVMRQAGWLITTPLQARARADVILFAGPVPDDFLRFDGPPALRSDLTRRVIRLCPGHRSAELPTDMIIGDDPAQLPLLLGVLRALVAGHEVRPDATLLEPLSACAMHLGSAAFGVAVWSAATMDPLSIEMLCGLIDDLNKKTRFAGLPTPPPGNAVGVVQAAAWTTGFPPRTGFTRKEAEHDPWRFDATRMIDSGEADAALWISAFAPEAPPWRRHVPLIALAAPGARFRVRPEVSITVGHPGVDHVSVLFDPHLGTLVSKAAEKPGGVPSVADVVHRISAALPIRPQASC